MALLTSRTLATGVTINDLFHIVKPYDVSQNPAGSSYKASIGQLLSLFSSVISVTGVTVSAYTATTSYSYYGVEYSGITNIEIPSASGIDGYTLRVKDERGTASTYPIIITPSVGFIDNNPSVTMSINNMSLTMVARNNNWWII